MFPAEREVHGGFRVEAIPGDGLDHVASEAGFIGQTERGGICGAFGINDELATETHPCVDGVACAGRNSQPVVVGKDDGVESRERPPIVRELGGGETGGEQPAAATVGVAGGFRGDFGVERGAVGCVEGVAEQHGGLAGVEADLFRMAVFAHGAGEADLELVVGHTAVLRTQRNHDVVADRFPFFDVKGEFGGGGQGTAIVFGTGEIQVDAVGNDLVVRDGDADRVISTQAGTGEQRGGLDVSAAFRIKDLTEKHLLGMAGSEVAKYRSERACGYETFPETVPVRGAVHLGWSEVFGSCVSLERNLGDQVFDHGIGGVPIDFRMVVEDDAMTQDRRGDGFDVLERGIGTAVDEGAGFGSGGHGERGARAGAKTDLFCRVVLAGMGGIDEACDVVSDDIGKVNAAHQSEQIGEGFRGHDGGHLGFRSEFAMGNDALQG